MTNYNPQNKVLLLRTCNSDMTSPSEEARGFRWPESGPVEAPDWDGGKPVCGRKLHGFLWGEGRGDFALWSSDARWLVIASDPGDVVEITEYGGGKHGFRRGEVVFCGSREAATTFIIANGATGRAVIGATVSAGDYGAATAGYGGEATAGNRGTATAGDGGKATAGDGGNATAGDGGEATAGHRGTATAGDRGTATAGYGGTATAGDEGTAMAGNGGTATAGHWGKATAGDRGTATAGDKGMATAGDDGMATAGNRGTAKAGERGIISLSWWDESARRTRRKTGHVGEDGIEANTRYRLVEGEFVAYDTNKDSTTAG